MRRSRLRTLARANIRQRRGGFAAVFVAVFCAALLTCALGVLFESGIRGGVTPHRYAGADVVVGGAQSLDIPEDIDPQYAERALLPGSTVAELSAVPGVRAAVGDISVPLTTDDGRLLDGHGWTSAALAPYTLTTGRAPAAPDEVVVTGPGEPGDRITLRHGGIGAEYTVVGVAATPTAEPTDRPAAVFLSDDRARDLWPHGDRVAAVGLLADTGFDASSLAVRARDALAGTDVRTYTGDGRGDVEYLDAGAARSELMMLCGSFAGLAILIAMFVVASTLSLSIQQRRREFALLRATGATPGQIHRLIGSEVLLVAGVAALLGAGPGYALAQVLRAQFTEAGVLPSDFALAYGPLPAVVGVLLAVGTARAAAAVAARRPARLDPTEALRESAVEPATIGRGRLITGVVFASLGLAASLLPAFLPGPAALAGAGGSAVLLVIAVALLGPMLVSGAIRWFGGPLRRSSSPALVLAAANSGARARRLAAAITPLALAIAIGSVQLFSQSTVATAADAQSRSGITADLVVTAPAGLAPALVDAISANPAVRAANPITRSQALYSATDREAPMTEPYAVQGVDPAATGPTLDLDIRDGDLGQLRDGTVALSTDAAFGMGARVGDTVPIRLGDGTLVTPTVIATYGRGLGFGDVTLPASQVRAHTTTGLTDMLLVTAEPGRVDAARAAIAETGGVVVSDRAEFAAAGQEQRRTQAWVSIVALAVLLGYLAVAVVNTLVLATAERGREFALLRLVGASTRQVRRMMRVESVIIVTVAAVVGSAIALPPLAGVAAAVSGRPVPSVSPLAYALILGVTVVLGLVAIAIPTRTAMRQDPVTAIGTRE
ncbi:FtsX-like permease family protein [Prescottella agglutinans]|uniref:ABC transport system permease protein n=1 Tax=Prescottella agglutinans TaxID=1644129 RepID=A0ABT6MBC8_9NOCA|nr:FtsX-like permease family protein [Prescottella agglutinans]MDH6281602.1 putative ABC transport system permease protein [Prescottella agglutinans]